MRKTKGQRVHRCVRRWEEAAQAARSLVEHTRDAALSLTLVDNASPDGRKWLCGAAS